MSAGRRSRALAKAPLIAPARHGLGIQPCDRPARPGGRGGSGKRLADFLEQRLFKPLRCWTPGFWVPQRQVGARSRSRCRSIPRRRPAEQADRRLGGAGERFRRRRRGFDRERLSALRADAAERRALDGARVLSRDHRALMTSDHLGTRIAAPVTPGELLLGTPGYTFGLGFAVRQGAGDRRRVRDRRRVHVGRLCRDLFLGRSRRSRSSPST